MAFLDNSGDIILDAVLTDTGRMRMARGDGSFKITKFAFGDDEINYGLYNPTDIRGSAYYDIEIMQTPILEAFTNNTSGMHSRLMSLANNPGLYLPVILPNRLDSPNAMNTNLSTFLCAVDKTTQTGIGTSGDPTAGSIHAALGFSNNTVTGAGIISGYNDTSTGVSLRIDQGIDAPSGPSSENDISAELYESQYLIEMDSRLCTLISADGNTMAAVSFIDDDSIASYYLSQAVNGTFITTNTEKSAKPANQVIDGPRGSILNFSLRASINLQTSEALFTTLGGTMSAGANTYYFIDSVVRVSGVTTGSRLDIPIRFVKYLS